MEDQPVSRKKQLIASLAVLIIIVVIVGAVTLAAKKKSSTVTMDTTGSLSAADSTSSNTPASYKNGTYSAKGEYSSPGGQEAITISVTLKDGVITDTSATSGANDGEAREYQSQFISGYKSLVVGKSINSVKLSRVSGSSLTSQGFNEAIDQIKSDAATS